MTKRYEAVVLDFDGVVLESVDAKGDAFVELFADHPAHAAAIARYHVENAGQSRYVKVERMYRDVLGLHPDRETIDRAIERFGRLAVDRVLACPWVPGAREFLEAQSRSRSLYIVSATPDGEIRGIVDRLGIGAYVRGVHGSPEPKTRWIGEVVAHTGGAERVLVIGDARDDLAAAASCGTAFVGRRRGEVDQFAGAAGVETIVDDLYGLTEWLEDQEAAWHGTS